MEIQLLKKEQLTEDNQSQITLLYRQLNAEVTQRSLHEILVNGNNVVVAICLDEELICGIALMATYKVISGHRGMIEDVVVAADQRGKGIGRKLMLKLLDEANVQKLDEVLLFTGHHREPAINLYKSLGFVIRNSGLYMKRLN